MVVAALAATSGCSVFAAERVPVGYDGSVPATCSDNAMWLVDGIAGTLGVYLGTDRVQAQATTTNRLFATASIVLAVVELAGAVNGYSITEDCESAKSLRARRVREAETDELRAKRRRPPAPKIVDDPEPPADAGVPEAPADGAL